MLDIQKCYTLEAKGMEKNILPPELEDSLKNILSPQLEAP